MAADDITIILVTSRDVRLLTRPERHLSQSILQWAREHRFDARTPERLLEGESAES